MAGSMNKVILIGRLGQDPKLSYTTSGQAVAEFSVATDESYQKDGQWVDSTEWHRVKVWREKAERCANSLSKGRLVLVEGKLQTRQWEKDGQKHYMTEVIATRVAGLDRAQGGDAPHDSQEGGHRPQRPASQNQRQAPAQGAGAAPQQYRDEDLGPAFPSEAGAMDDVPF